MIGRGWGAALAVSIALALAVEARAQQPGGETRGDALRVFLDCNTFPCDFDYFRTEVSFVNWVRDRTLAQVHVLITSNETGGGGEVYTLDFVGLQDLEGRDDELTATALATDTEDETLGSLSRVLAVGLARYSTLAGRSQVFDITEAEGPETGQLVGTEQVDDPWDFWVFELSANFDLEGEETERQREESGSFEASRTTDEWRFELEVSGNFSQDERELDDTTTIFDNRTNWNASTLLAYALADHWSLGIIAGAGASTSRNQVLGGEFSAAIEFSFFPYVDAPRQSLTARYDFGLRYFDWEEETIYFRTQETRPQHQLRLQLFQRQPWGESRLSLDGRQFLHDLAKWSVEVSGELELRVTRGLELELRGDVQFLEDQLFISREGLTVEDILLGRFERPTSYTYELSVGLGFQFGSIFNNVVNNRFGGGGNGDFN